MSRAESMICVKPAARIARSFASSGPASVIVSMPKWSMFIARALAQRVRWLTTSSNVTPPR